MEFDIIEYKYSILSYLTYQTCLKTCIKLSIIFLLILKTNKTFNDSHFYLLAKESVRNQKLSTVKVLI